MNVPLSLNIQDDYADSGWEVSAGIATHYPCNAGYIKISGLNIKLGDSYVIEYEVSNYVSGIVRSSIGTSNGASRNAAGVFRDTITAVGNTDVRLYSDGMLSASRIKIFPLVQSEDTAVTLAFSEDLNRWVSYYSYAPEMMVKFANQFFSFKDGSLWLHNVNPIRNNFYGVQYESMVKFYVNIDPERDKDFYNMIVNSNKPWFAPDKGDIFVFPRKGKTRGQASRLKEKRFKFIKGKWQADFLRDMNDPRYENELDALLKGANIQGPVMEVTLINREVTEVRLISIEVEVSS